MSKIKKIINYFFYHRFSDAMIDRVHSRLSLSGEDQEKEDTLQAIWEEIGYPDAEQNTQQAFTELEEKLGMSLPGKKQIKERKTFHIPVWTRTAAIWLIPLLSIVFSFYMYRKSIDKEAIAFIEHYVPAGKREQVVLPDGSHVWLNSGTLLIYPTSFSRENREVYLAGEGYFSVEKHEKHPFIVKTRTLQVEVLGTKFNLSAYPEAIRMITTLEQGSVKVSLHNELSSSFLLKPNEQLIYTPETGMVEQMIVRATDYSDWREGGLLFKGTPFDDVLKKLEQVYGIKIHLQTSTYHANRLTIHFNKNESLENVMSLIKEMIPGLEYRIDDKELYLK